MPDKLLSGICVYALCGKCMQPKILSKRTLLLVVVLPGLALFLSLLFYFIPQNSIQGGSASVIESAVALQKQEQASPELPVRLKIPSIHVDAPIEGAGLTSDGAMDVPKGPVKVAWFNLGPRPGETGSSVIAGHYGWKYRKGSAFDNLHKLRKGDKIYIEDDKGVTISFVVRESRRYDPKADASDVFGSNDGKPHLNLITCEGVWDKVSKTYSKRLVVFTDKE
ncbi:MAG: class F sortase [bacterium]|nr:class F sortase [bacterium]